MMISLFFTISLVAMATGDPNCSTGDVNYLCVNVGTCWSHAGFNNEAELRLICEMQGYEYGDNGDVDSENAVRLTVPPRNLTVPEGSTAAFKCEADNAIKVVIQKESDFTEDVPRSGNPTQQNVIQEINDVLKEHEGWYVCTAYGAGGTVVSERAYLEIKDVCEGHDCVAPKECVPDIYTGTYTCECPGDCPMTYDPVCGSDCESYFNECNLKQKACEAGSDVVVHSKGLCSFSPSTPDFTAFPTDREVKEGSNLKLSAAATVGEGAPAAKFTWFVGGEKVGKGKNFKAKMDASMEGNWEVKASMCNNKYVATRSFQISMKEAVTEVTDPGLYCCKVYGDPHVLTFDQKAYDYMGTGSYIIAMDKEDDGRWMIYGTFERCGDKTKQLSCIISITIYLDNNRVQFNRMWRVNNEGEDFSIGLGESRYIGGLTIENRNMEYVITLGDTGVVAKWDGIVTSQVCVEKCAGSVRGLCGDADCDDSNEFGLMGQMNPYTNSFSTDSSTEFGNSWTVDPTIGQPETASLAAKGSPCDRIPAAERAAYEARCEAVADLDIFDPISLTTISTENYLANCYYDSCAGLVFGMGCKDRGDADCSAEIEALIAAAIAAGMSREEAVAMYTEKYLDPACIMGMNMARDLISWGVQVDNDWRVLVEPFCPSDEELLSMEICPTL